MRSAFSYREGVLCAENLSLEKIAEEVGTPCYVYSTEQLQRNYKAFADGFQGMKVQICYAVKANANLAIIRTLAACGAGADITSVGELERALSAGIKPEKIAYSGVGKGREEIRAALIAGVHQLNVESLPELRQISEVAVELHKQAALTLRVNPNVDAQTHKHLSTGEQECKFGIEMEQIDEAMRLATRLPNLDFKGFHVHVGSHVSNYEPFREAFLILAELVQSSRAKGFTISRLDLGGGVGIPYDGQTLPPLSDYASIVKETLGDLGCELMFEPGRRLVGDAGVLVSRVIYDKEAVTKRFLILDAAMNDLVRPAMYGARHNIVPVRKSAATDAMPADVVGPVCEGSDVFGEDYTLPGIGQGDLVAILQGGAYAAAMSSNYNGRPLIPEILVSGSDYALVRRRISVAEQMKWEALPAWMAPLSP